MFTLEQINEIHDRVGNEDTLALYLQELREIGVDRCDSYITDGHSEYFGKDGYKLVSPPAHEKLVVAETSNRETFLQHMNLAEQGKTSYLEMSRGLADSGVGKWTFDTQEMTLTYFGKDGSAMLVESFS
jgi:uncharacterized protein YbcV (DUF1398 family)